MGILKAIFKVFGINSGAVESTPNPRLITNELLLNELANVFATRLKEESVRQRMLFPMCFNVLMHKDDYYNRKDALAMVLPEVVAEFYSIIKKNLSRYPNFIPPAKNWYFQFSPCQIDSITLEDGSVLKIEKGHLTTTARLFTTEEADNDVVNIESNTRVSVKCQNSDVIGAANINWEALVGVDMLSEGVFKYKFDKKLGDEPVSQPMPLSPTPVPAPVPAPVSAPKKEYAKLMYDYEGACLTYMMRDTQVLISGETEAKQRSVFYVKNEAISTPHTAVKYSEETGKFQIAAFDKVRLNGRSMNISTPDNPEWRDLPNKSKIFMNDVLTVRFEKLV